MKEAFERWTPNQKSLEIVKNANEIIEAYGEQGYTLTLRQLFYRFVALDLTENTQKNYKNFGVTIKKARDSGLIDWSAIEDRHRQFNQHWSRPDVNQIIEDLPDFFRNNKIECQETYFEVWVEKDALGNVVAKACDKYMTPYMSCKGFLSTSEMYSAAKRFGSANRNLNVKRLVLIHLGDHDPSGIDMTRDNAERLKFYSRDLPIEINRIALNMDQISQYKPPPNPARQTDSRYASYIKQFGNESWELDALEPKTLKSLIQREIELLIDFDLFNQMVEREKEAKGLLQSVGEHWPVIRRYLNFKSKQEGN